MRSIVPFQLRGKQDSFIVEYNKNSSAEDSGFDTLLDLPFDYNDCLGYPTLHAYFDNINLKGYRRYCGWIQLVERQEINKIDGRELCDVSISLDISDDMRRIGMPYFAYGYPAEIYDAPCNNLGNNDKLIWTAYTYLIDIPSRMNGNKLSFIAGFSWGYVEDKNGPIKLLDFNILSNDDWEKHLQVVNTQCPNFTQ